MGSRLYSAVFGILVSIAAPVSAAPILAGYPAPGGTDYSGSGFHLGSGGATWTYSNFDTAAWDQLWWGIEDLQAAMDGAIDEPGETLSLESLSGATAIWSGTTSIDAGNVETRVTATILSGGSNWIDPTSVGITSPNIFAVSEVDGSVDFVVSALFEARFAGDATWTAWFPFFDPNTGMSEDGNSRTSLYRNFYYAPTSQVPLPAALPLALAGIGALSAVRLRRRA